MAVEARMELVHGKLVPQGEGWFVLNVEQAPWHGNDRFGATCVFEGKGAARFDHLGINVHVIAPGQPSGMYHRETLQESFMVLAGECLLLIDGQERRLRAWDFVHCPAGTDHVFVGTGAGPCVLLMVGARAASKEITYPVSELALRHQAGVTRETHLPREAYAGLGWERMPMTWPPS